MSRPAVPRAARHRRRFARFVAPARTRPALWRLLAGLVLAGAVQVLALAGAFGALAVLAGPQAASSWMARLAVASTPVGALALLAGFAPLLGGVWLAARLLHGRPLRGVLGAQVLRGAARGAGVTLAVFAPLLAFSVGFGGTQPNLPAALWVQILPLALAGIAVQTLAEEALFRGYMAQQLAARCASPLVWAGLPALAFGALHWDTGRMGDAAPVAAGMAALFGLLAADLTARTGGIGAAWGLHLANNTVGLALLATQGGITGLALRVTPHAQAELAQQPLLVLAGGLPVLIAWAILRRG